MEPDNCIKVKRDGPRGWHWIARADFDPAVHEIADGGKGVSLPKPRRRKAAA